MLFSTLAAELSHRNSTGRCWNVGKLHCKKHVLTSSWILCSCMVSTLLGGQDIRL